MTTQYRPTGAQYDCSRPRADHTHTPGCRSVNAAVVDELVARRLLQALAPEELALALSAADELQDRRTRSNRTLELHVERARYDAARAERAFHACESDNRLVARSLEDRWEQKLRGLKDAEAELAEHATPAPEPSREQLEALARNLPALWAAQSTAHRDRKRLLRSLIADITLTSDPHEPAVRVGIRWQSGAAEQHTVTRPQGIIRRTPPEALELLSRHGPHHSNEVGAWPCPGRARGWCTRKSSSTKPSSSGSQRARAKPREEVVREAVMPHTGRPAVCSIQNTAPAGTAAPQAKWEPETRRPPVKGPRPASSAPRGPMGFDTPTGFGVAATPPLDRSGHHAAAAQSPPAAFPPERPAPTQAKITRGSQGGGQFESAVAKWREDDRSLVRSCSRNEVATKRQQESL